MIVSSYKVSLSDKEWLLVSYKPFKDMTGKKKQFSLDCRLRKTKPQNQLCTTAKQADVKEHKLTSDYYGMTARMRSEDSFEFDCLTSKD